MNLLLILSALMTALTGAISGVRGVEVAQHRSSAVARSQVQVAAAPRVVISIPAVSSPALPALAQAAALPVIRALAAPLYASRLRI